MSVDKLDTDVLLKTARALQLEAELWRIGSALSTAGIEWVSMKGPVLARRLGVEPHHRGFIVDNDVLVRRRDVKRAVQVVRALGYAPLPFLELDSQLDVNFEIAMRRKQSGVWLWLEVHWAPFPRPLYSVDGELVWRHTEVIEISGRQVRVFDPALTIAHLASHFVQHRAWHPRILNDVAWAWNLWHAVVDRGCFRELVQALRLEHVVAYSLHVAEDRGLLDIPPPFDTRRAEWLRRIVPASGLDEQRPRTDYLRRLAMLLVAPPERVPRWLWSMIVPPIDVMAFMYDRPATPALYLRYFTRLFRPFGRRMGWVK